MEIEIVVPELGESITEATVSAWLKAPGDALAEGDLVVELETDKVMVEVPAAKAGVLTEVLKADGEKVTIGEVLGRISTDAATAKVTAKAAAPPAPAPVQARPAAMSEEADAAAGTAPAPPDMAAAPFTARAADGTAPAPPDMAAAVGGGNASLSPAVQRIVSEYQLDPAVIPGTGRRGQVTKADVVNFMDRAAAAGKANAATPASAPTAPSSSGPAAAPTALSSSAPASTPDRAAVPAAPGERERRVPMSRLRLRIAERLLAAQANAAILTTFNEVDMSAAMALRNKYKEAFREKYGAALGFMSLFTKASIEALRAFPAVNGEIQGTDIIYKNYYDIGVAVSTERGLVVPVVRNADSLRFIEIELEIAALAKRAREGKLSIGDLTGGTFTISNGGIYGSMLSTPILNPPQSGILGLHNITKRAVVENDEVVVRPMMYIALSYDHRIIDGREAVQFLLRIKECMEDPAHMMLEI